MLHSLDIRLLCVFDAIYKARSVTSAAQTLNLGQPAVSIALARLREHFDDQLFVKTSKGMAPTPFADGLASPIRAVLEALQVVLGQRNEFDPTVSDRTFRICMTDISQLVLLPGLLRKLREAAPGICIEVLPLNDDTAGLLENGDADLALGFMPQLEAGFYQQVLFRQTFVCMVGKNHPRISRKLTLAQFEAEEHAVISASGAAPFIIDREIARQGIRRRIVLTLPNFLGAAFVAEHTDVVITIPARLAEVLRGHGAFHVFPVPFPIPTYEVKQLWHQRYHNDPGNRWLRVVLAELLLEPPPASSKTRQPA